MKIRMVVPVVAALAMTPALWAQEGGAAAANKVGIINLQAAIASTAEGKQANSELQSQFAPRQAELQQLQKQIQDVQGRLQTGQTTLSETEMERLTDEGQRDQRTLQRKQQDAQADFTDAQQDAINRIGRKMMTVLDKYAKDHGYTLVLDVSSQQTPVVYAATQADITQEIVHLYDAAYPVSGSSSSATPSAPAPAHRATPARK
ncbi:MAG: OmpH family outer membrane protein [Acidobacteriota bacterium]|nr:OmpH family outer membrane protein [Acidobacteriota bacterium]